MKSNLFYLVIFLLFFNAIGCKKKEPQDFISLNNSKKWELQFTDECTLNWQYNWFKDGLISSMEQDEKGMNLIAGPENRNDAHHTVIWTKKTFKGDVKIGFNYTRTDSQVVNVNILYIQAQGIGRDSFDVDISKWNKFRETPTMSIYYNYMNPLHISFAAFPMENKDPQNDYIRVRKYPISDEITFDDIEVEPTYFKTGLFLPGETYKITVIKTKTKLHFNVKGNNEQKLYSWVLNENQSPEEGRIGLRHMFTRSARYKDFKIYTK